MSDFSRPWADATRQDDERWEPAVLDASLSEDAKTLRELFAAGHVRQVYDTIEEQLRDLVDSRVPQRDLSAEELDVGVRAILGDTPVGDYGRWVFYPWSGRLVHLLPPEEFHTLRLDRNRLKVSEDEQEKLSRLCVGVVGLSVGNAVALTLALEGTCGHLKLADFDRLDLSNMNRIRAGVHDIGVRKTVLAARQVKEIDPYVKLSLFSQGLSADNLDDFLLGGTGSAGPRVDVLVDECDGLDVKVMLRNRARELRLPVLMETSDRGMLDVERFDLEEERPIFHGLVGPVDAADLENLEREQKVDFVLKVLGAESMSTHMAASLLEVEQTISTWPQLASDVTLGGASVTAAVRRIGLGQRLTSGRRYVDLSATLAADVQPREEVREEKVSPSVAVAAETSNAPVSVSPLLRFVVEHAVLAPSGGNCQPWRFHADGETLHVVHDEARSRNILDCGHRASRLALGAAIENISIAAAHRGYRTLLSSFPRGEQDPLAGSLTFEPAVNGELMESAKLYPLLQLRVTNRRFAAPDPLGVDEARALTRTADACGASLRLLEDRRAMGQVGDVLGRGDRLRFLCTELHRELVAELRWSDDEARATRDGIDLATLELSPAESAAMRVVARPDVVALLRALGRGRGLEEGSGKAVDHCSALGLLTLNGSRGVDFLEGGRTLQRIWLTATGMGLALQPVTALLYMFEMLNGENAQVFTPREKDELRDLEARLNGAFALPSDTTKAILFRLAKAPAPSARALRLPVDRVLSVGAPF